MNLLQRLEALEARKAATKAHAPKNDAERAALLREYLASLRRKHPELVPTGDGYWPFEANSTGGIPVENLRQLAQVDRVASLVLRAYDRMTAAGHDLM